MTPSRVRRVSQPSEIAGLSALVTAHLKRLDGPRFRALGDALRLAISSGVVPRGTRLPSERDLAQRTGLGRETVTRAYDVLRREGWARSRPGSGTFAAHPDPAGPQRWTRDPIDDADSARAPRPGVIDLSRSKPTPVGELLRHAGEVAAHALPTVAARTEYATHGLRELRETIAARFTSRGLPTSTQQVIVTTGAQQAINLIAQLHVRPGSPVLTESPTYVGAIDAFRLLRAELMTFDPLAADAAEHAVNTISFRQPSLVFTMATCNTVTGQVATAELRRAIATAAEAHQVAVIDDDIFSGLTFEHDPTPPMASYAEDAPIYVVGSMSKLAWNGLRVGWLRAPHALATRIARLKGTGDLGTSLVAQLVAHELLTHDAELAQIRRDEAHHAITHATATLAQLLPRWQVLAPQGGRSLWIALPRDGPTAHEITQAAQRHGVLLTSGDLFSPDNQHRNHLRIMPVQAEGDLHEGLRRLHRAAQTASPQGHRQRQRRHR